MKVQVQAMGGFAFTIEAMRSSAPHDYKLKMYVARVKQSSAAELLKSMCSSTPGSLDLDLENLDQLVSE